MQLEKGGPFIRPFDGLGPPMCNVKFTLNLSRLANKESHEHLVIDLARSRRPMTQRLGFAICGRCNSPAIDGIHAKSSILDWLGQEICYVMVTCLLGQSRPTYGSKDRAPHVSDQSFTQYQFIRIVLPPQMYNIISPLGPSGAAHGWRDRVHHCTAANDPIHSKSSLFGIVLANGCAKSCPLAHQANQGLHMGRKIAYRTRQSAGCLRSTDPSLGIQQLSGDITKGQWRHN